MLRLASPLYPSRVRLAKMARDWPSLMISAVFILVVVGMGIDLAKHSDTYQLDLRTYYFAGKAFSEGGDPYDLDVLSEISQGSVVHGFVYPPTTLYLLAPLAKISFTTVYYGVFAIKAILLACLAVLWKRAFLPEMEPAFLLYSALAFNAAIYVDLRVGNIAIFEQALIWTGFAFLLRERALGFVLLIVAAGSFKLTPLLLLPLALASREKHTYPYLFIPTLAFLVLNVISAMAHPSFWQGFAESLISLDERGAINPSTWAFISDISELFAPDAGLPSPFPIKVALYFAVALAVGWAFMVILRATQRWEWADRMKVRILTACIVYSLILPRLKAYSYIILLLPTYGAIWLATSKRAIHSRKSRWMRWIIPPAVALLSSVYGIAEVANLSPDHVLGYSPLLVAYLSLGAYLLFLRSERTQPSHSST